MSWSIEEHIGEGRPWPEQVVVYRGETDESLTYARRSLSDVNKMVELMDTLAADNAKLRELVRHMHTCMEHYEMDGTISCDRCPLDNCVGNCDYERRMRELGVEVVDA